MKKVLVRGPALSQSGYGEHTRFLLRALRSREDIFDIHLLNVPWGQTGWIWEANEERQWLDFLLQKTIQYTQQGGQFDISLQVTIPQEWEKLAPVNIGVTAGTETTKISPKWVEKTFMMDKIIVVSEHTKYGFMNTEYPAMNQQTGEQFTAKTNCPVEVVGYPVKEIEAKEVELELENDFNFLAVGTWIPRKNLENTIKWFVEEFHDQEVGLVVKTSLAKNCLRDREVANVRLNQLLNEYTNRKCNVYLLHGDMTEEEMTGVYNHPKIKALVNFSHGEGFGLPMFEAAYNGVPVIAPAWGGQCDFLYMNTKSKNGKEKKTPMFTTVPFDIKPIQKEAVWDGVLQADSQWCFPIEWAAKKALRSVVKEYGAAQSKAKKLQNWVKKEYSQDKQFEKMLKLIDNDISLEKSDYIFVSDFFQNEYVGGAEMSLQALINKCPSTKSLINSSNLTVSIIKNNKDCKWIFGNISQVSEEVLDFFANSKIEYYFIEFDYKFCEYRNPALYEFLEDEGCNYKETRKANVIDNFAKNAKKMFFMSEKQKEIYNQCLSGYSNIERNIVLSSVFDDDFFDTINKLRKSKEYQNKKGWIVLGSRSWVKGSANSEKWCKDNNLDYEVVFDVPHEEMLKKIAASEGICFKPTGLDTCPRIIIESKLLGCKLEINDNVQHMNEEWFNTDNIESIENYLKNRSLYFWNLIDKNE